VAQVVEYLSSKHKALSSTKCHKKIKKERKKTEKEIIQRMIISLLIKNKMPCAQIIANTKERIMPIKDFSPKWPILFDSI
jgi:hypothetical protein